VHSACAANWKTVTSISKPVFQRENAAAATLAMATLLAEAQFSFGSERSSTLKIAGCPFLRTNDATQRSHATEKNQRKCSVKKIENI